MEIGGENMYLTHSCQIRNLTKKEFEVLRVLCRTSKNLYNVALYNIRQYFFEKKKYLSYNKNYHLCKTDANYKMLQAGVAQSTLQSVNQSFKSFFALNRKAKEGEYESEKVCIPKYLKKDSLYPLICHKNAIYISKGFFTVPLSEGFRKENPNIRIRIPFPEKLKNKQIKQVLIVPQSNGRFFKVNYVYLEKEENLELNKDNWLSIDFGINNLASCISHTGASFIVDGKKLKSINQYYNKRRAKLRSIADKQNLKSTKKMDTLSVKRHNQIRDYMRKTARYIIDYCKGNDIGKVIIGYNASIRNHMKMGRKNNQHFSMISFGKLRESIETLCKRYGIKYTLQEESYTSKASFFDNDEIPIYDEKKEHTYLFSGKRIKRGLYKTANGQLINADINAALNIMRKSKQEFNYEQLCKGALAAPIRIRIV